MSVTVKVVRDGNAESPRDGYNLGIMACYRKR